jgi:hypothetical protein
MLTASLRCAPAQADLPIQREARKGVPVEAAARDIRV